MCGIADANSGEFDEYGLNKVIDFMPDQSSTINMGGTLRLGSYPCEIAEGTQMARCYGVSHIDERHRHRYEFNNDYRETLTKAGMVISGTSPACSSTRNLSPARIRRIRYSSALSAHHSIRGKRTHKRR